MSKRLLWVDAEAAMVQEKSCCESRTSAETTRRVRVERGGAFAAMGSVLAAIVASACCWFPLLLLGVGVSAGGIAGAFEKTRPLFLAVAIVLLGLGFYIVYFRRSACSPEGECSTPPTKIKMFNQVMLWVATVAVAGFAFFPSYVGILLGGSTDPLLTDDSSVKKIVLAIDGMTCEGCTAPIERELSSMHGVASASIDYEKAEGLVFLDSENSCSPKDLVATVERAGFQAKVVSQPEED